MKIAIPILAALLMAAPAWSSEAELEQLSPPAAEGRVTRALFTTDVVDREPTDEVTSLENDHPRVFYFTELAGMTGRTVIHRWQYEGEVKAEVSYAVGGPRWRVFSSKSLDPSWLGEWTVTLVDDEGRELRSDRFVYTEIVEDDDPSIPAAPAPDQP